MGSREILLVAAVVLIPLMIAVAVTLWTLEPAARRAERAKRGRKPAKSDISLTVGRLNDPVAGGDTAGTAGTDDQPSSHS